MAGGTDIIISVDAKQGTSTMYKFAKDFNSIRDQVEKPIVVKFDKQTNYTKQMADDSFWAGSNNFGKKVRSLHIYGIDPLTRGFAKLGSTVLGSFIHPITLAATASMFLFTQLKKVILTSNDLINRNQGVIRSIDKKVSKLEKEKKSFDEVIDKVKELQKENRKLNDSQRQLAAIYAHRLQQKGLISRDVQFDANGNIANIDAISEEAYTNASSKIIEQLNKKDDRLSQNLDLTLSKFFGWTDKNSEYFRTGKVDPNMNIEKLLPWIQKLTKAQIQNAKNSLDITKLYSGNLQSQYQFFQSLKLYTNDKEKFDVIDKILQFLETKLDIKDKLQGIVNGINKTEDQMKAISKGFNELSDIQRKINEKNAAHKEQMSGLRDRERTSGMTARERAEDEQKKAIEASFEAAKARRQIAQKQKDLASKGWVKEGDQVKNVILDNMKQRNPRLRQLEKTLKQYQKERDQQIQSSIAASLEYINNPHNQERQNFLTSRTQESWTEDDKEFMKMMRGQRVSVLTAKTNAEQTFKNRTDKIYDEIKQILGENADTFLTIRQQTEDAKRELLQIQKLTDTAAKKEKESLQSKINAAQFDKQADKEEADKTKREQKFWQNIINPHLRNTIKNSNAVAEFRFGELLKDLEEVKGKQNITEEDKERLRNAAKLEDVNQKIQDALSKDQYTIKNDEFARKGGGYDFYVEQLNPIKNVENLEKQQVELLKQLVDSSNNNASIFAQGFLFK